MSGLLGLDIAGLAALLRRRAVSPVEVTSAALSRIERLDGHLRSFITIADAAALDAARRAEAEIARGHYRGPLHGVPLALKDVIATAGIRTTQGSRIFAGEVPAEDAQVVLRLKDAGAIVLGKNNMHELAMGSTTANPYFGVCRNPWRLEHVPGGSSGGSAAAVAARLCFGAIASDTAGSIRSPASQCGVVGLKPTAGRVSRRGVATVSETLDHVGPIARTARDAALLLEAIADGPPLAEAEPRDGLAGVTLGMPTHYFFDGVDAEVEQRVREAVELLRQMGAAVRPLAWPRARETAEAALTISAYEAARLHEARLAERPRDYSDELRARLQSGLRIPQDDYRAARAKLAGLQRDFLAAMEGIDLFAAPANPVAAPRHGEATVRVGGAELPIGAAMPRFGAPQNATGCPAISIPCGLTASGLPVGLQLVARPLCESLLVRVAAAYQGATTWHARLPAAIESLLQ